LVVVDGACTFGAAFVVAEVLAYDTDAFSPTSVYTRKVYAVFAAKPSTAAEVIPFATVILPACNPLIYHSTRYPVAPAVAGQDNVRLSKDTFEADTFGGAVTPLVVADAVAYVVETYSPAMLYTRNECAAPASRSLISADNVPDATVMLPTNPLPTYHSILYPLAPATADHDSVAFCQPTFDAAALVGADRTVVVTDLLAYPVEMCSPTVLYTWNV